MTGLIEGDSKVIYKDLINLGPSLALHGHLIFDVLQLANAFVHVSFTHICRIGNNVAHSLARRAISTPDINIWMEEVPPNIVQFVQADLTALFN